MHKVLIVATEFPPQPGGIGVHALNLAKQLSHSGNEIHVLAPNRTVEGREEAEFDRRQDFRVTRLSVKGSLFSRYRERIQQVRSCSKQCSLVIASGKFALWMVGLGLKQKNLKKIAVVHGSELLLPYGLLRRLTDRSLHKMDRIVAVSNYTKGLLRISLQQRTLVINNGFDIERTARAMAPLQAPLKLVTVGNLTPRKGQQNFIRVLPKLMERHPDLEYHLVGIPTQAGQLTELAQSLDVLERLHIHGRLSDMDREKILQQSHIFIMLSQRTSGGDVEGFGIAILEANALGLPAIGSKGSGIEDAIKHGFSGQLVDPFDPKQILDAIDKICSDFMAYSQNALDWSQGFQWEKVVEKYKEVMQELLG